MKDNDTFDIDDVAEMIEIEGFLGALLDYILPDDIEDVKLSKLWRMAKNAVEEIGEIVGGF